MNVSALAAALDARSVALLGATPNPDKLAYGVWQRLCASSLKHVWAVNPKYRAIGQRRCYPDLDAIDQSIDLAVVALPAHRVAQAVEWIGKKGLSTALLLFDPTWPAGDRAWLEHIQQTARRAGVRLIGPDSFGLIMPRTGLNAGLWNTRPASGDVALIAQSGAVAGAALERLVAAGVGLSRVISSGLEVDVDCAALLEYLAHDPSTRIIAVHVEAIRRPRSFYAALREASRRKRVVVLKSRDDEHFTAERLASFKYHTGTGRDDAFEALIEGAGGMRVDRFDDFVGLTIALTRRARPRGASLAVISNSSAFAGLAASDAAVGGIELTSFSAQTALRLRLRFPQTQLPVNPIDLGAGATAEELADAVVCVAEDPRIDAVLAIAAPGARSTPAEMSQALVPVAARLEKPVLLARIGGTQTVGTAPTLDADPAQKLITLSDPVGALRIFSTLARQAAQEHARAVAPAFIPTLPDHSSIEAIREIVRKALDRRRHLLSIEECEAVVTRLGAQMPPSRNAATAADVPSAYNALQGRIVLKVLSSAVAHKTDVDGVRLDLRSADEAQRAFDEVRGALKRLSPLTPFEGVQLQRYIPHRSAHALRLAIIPDNVFGPLVEISAADSRHNARAFVAPAALGIRQASQLWRDAVQALSLPRHAGDQTDEAFVNLLLSLARVALDIPALYRISLNPVIWTHEGLVVLDATMHLADRGLIRDDALAAELSIAPSPSRREHWTRASGNMALRSMEEADFWRLKDFVNNLGEEGRRLRFHSRAPVTDGAIAQLSQLNYDREGAWVLVDTDDRFLAVARFSEIDDKEVEFAIAVLPDARREGLATRLMTFLEADVRQRGYLRLSGSVLRGNVAMDGLMQRLGYGVTDHNDTRRWSKSLKKETP